MALICLCLEGVTALQPFGIDHTLLCPLTVILMQPNGISHDVMRPAAGKPRATSVLPAMPCSCRIRWVLRRHRWPGAASIHLECFGDG